MQFILVKEIVHTFSSFLCINYLVFHIHMNYMFILLLVQLRCHANFRGKTVIYPMPLQCTCCACLYNHCQTLQFHVVPAAAAPHSLDHHVAPAHLHLAAGPHFLQHNCCLQAATQLKLHTDNSLHQLLNPKIYRFLSATLQHNFTGTYSLCISAVHDKH